MSIFCIRHFINGKVGSRREFGIITLLHVGMLYAVRESGKFLAVIITLPHSIVPILDSTWIGSNHTVTELFFHFLLI